MKRSRISLQSDRETRRPRPRGDRHSLRATTVSRPPCSHSAMRPVTALRLLAIAGASHEALAPRRPPGQAVR